MSAVRLDERLGLKKGRDFTISGIPRNLEGAKDLWQRDKYHFQKWAVEEVEGFVTTKCTGDGGIDGKLYFDMPGKKELQSMIISVKGGAKVKPDDLRSLHGVMEQDDAIMAGLITMDPLSDRQMQNFKQYMGKVGDLEVMGTKYPRLQILSVPDILDGERFKTPTPLGRSMTQQPNLGL